MSEEEAKSCLDQMKRHSALSDDELEKYFAISTDYKATRASMNLDKVGENVGTTMRRTGKKISGWFGGSKK